MAYTPQCINCPRPYSRKRCMSASVRLPGCKGPYFNSMRSLGFSGLPVQLWASAYNTAHDKKTVTAVMKANLCILSFFKYKLKILKGLPYKYQSLYRFNASR